jgi:hypothetical protein
MASVDLHGGDRSGTHVVQFYGKDEGALVDGVGRYLREGIDRGERLLVVARPARVEAFARRLDELGASAAEAQHAGRLVLRDAAELLARFMVDGMPDEARFTETVGGLVDGLRLRDRGQARPAGIRAYGEMVALLWEEDQRAAAIALEACWNRLIAARRIALYCAYPIDVFGDGFQVSEVDEVLCAHTHLLPCGDQLERAVDAAMDDVLGARADRLRPLIRANYRPAWAALPRAEAVVLWLRNNLPDEANAILAAARRRFKAATIGA